MNPMDQIRQMIEIADIQPVKHECKISTPGPDDFPGWMDTTPSEMALLKAHAPDRYSYRTLYCFDPVE